MQGGMNVRSLVHPSEYCEQSPFSLIQDVGLEEYALSGVSVKSWETAYMNTVVYRFT